VPTRDGRTAST